MQAPASTPLDRANAMIDRGELVRAKVELMRLARTASNDVGVLAPLSFVLAQLQDHERAAHYARRGVLREKFVASPICDGPRFAERFETRVGGEWHGAAP